MGWSYGPKPGNVKQYLMDLYTWNGEFCTSRALACRIVQLRTAYLAVERMHTATNTRRVWAAVVLLDYRPTDEYGFGYKDIDETMGPYDAACPEDILRLLTPLPAAQVYTCVSADRWERDYRDQAKQWRRRCWHLIRCRAESATIKPGDRLRFNDALTISRLGRVDTFDYVGSVPRFGRTVRNVFRPVSNGTAVLASDVRIPDWRTRGWIRIHASTGRACDDRAERYRVDAAAR